jgi:hypothetical protein
MIALGMAVCDVAVAAMDPHAWWFASGRARSAPKTKA